MRNAHMKTLQEKLPGVFDLVRRACNVFMRTGVVESGWKTRVLCPIPKVQGVVELERLRPLMFIEVLCKCVSGVMRNRHERGVVRMNLLSDMQWAYQKGKSTEAPLLVMNMVAEWAVLHRQELWDVGFDIKRCFDSYEWEMREVCLRRTGVGEDFIAAKRALEEGSDMVLLTKWGHSKVRGVAERGIPQGGEDSPLDFMCMNDVHMRMLEKRWGGGLK